MNHAARRLGGTAGLLIAALAIAGCASTGTRGASASAAAASIASLDRFCIQSQADISAAKIPAVVVLHTDYDAFVQSKPAVRPLRTEQYIWYADEARTQPKMISCKMKTADHIRTEYGAEAVGEEGLCSDVNRRTLNRVLASVGKRERRRLKFDAGTRVVFDADEVTDNGPIWLAPFPMASVGSDGALHLKSKAMRNDWLDPRLKDAPARFKGTRYCHLVAPSYLLGILRGDVTLQ
jgi:hypothetical protein